MKMISPKNQAEYDNLRNLLPKFDDEWSSVAMAGYRSEENAIDWVVFNDKINFEIDWNEGEPNNVQEEENCISE